MSQREEVQLTDRVDQLTGQVSQLTESTQQSNQSAVKVILGASHVSNSEGKE